MWPGPGSFLLLAILLLAFEYGSGLKRFKRALYSNKSTSRDASRVVSVITTSIYDHAEYCTGVLLTKNLVLTAAHCVYIQDMSEDDIKHVEVKQMNGLTVRVQRFFVHGKYKEGAKNPCNDVAILYLKRRVNVPLQPLILGCGIQHQLGECYAFGNGLTEELSFPLIQEPVHPDFKYDTCWETYYMGFSRLCQGDSGGPVICQMNQKSYLVGLNIQVISHYNAASIVDVCKLAYGSIITNFKAIVELMEQLPLRDRKLLKQVVKTEHC